MAGWLMVRANIFKFVLDNDITNLDIIRLDLVFLSSNKACSWNP